MRSTVPGIRAAKAILDREMEREGEVKHEKHNRPSGPTNVSKSGAHDWSVPAAVSGDADDCSGGTRGGADLSIFAARVASAYQSRPALGERGRRQIFAHGYAAL